MSHTENCVTRVSVDCELQARSLAEVVEQRLEDEQRSRRADDGERLPREDHVQQSADGARQHRLHCTLKKSFPDEV